MAVPPFISTRGSISALFRPMYASTPKVDHFALSSGRIDRIPLPEDFLLRGQVHAGHYYPREWFVDPTVDDNNLDFADGVFESSPLTEAPKSSLSVENTLLHGWGVATSFLFVFKALKCRISVRRASLMRPQLAYLLILWSCLTVPACAMPQENQATQGVRIKTHLLCWLDKNISWILGAAVIGFSMAWGVTQSQRPSSWSLKQTFRRADASSIFSGLVSTTLGFMIVRYIDRRITYKRQSATDGGESSHQSGFKLQPPDIYWLKTILLASTSLCLVYLYKGNGFTSHDAVVSIPVLFGLSAVTVDVSEVAAEARRTNNGGGDDDVADALLHLEDQSNGNTTNS